MPNGIPRKGEVLTQLSYFWFAQTESFQPNHLISRPGDPLPANLQPFADKLEGRSMIVKKAKPLAIECVVRGYLAGSGWKEYRERQSVCGLKLPPGLSLKQTMAIGTAGFTAMLALLTLEHHGLKQDLGEVLVTGASGGVGGVAVSLLSSLGYRVVASTGRPELRDYLASLGAKRYTFLVDASATSSPTPIIGRLLRLE